jgi:hypothetical protein
MRNGAWWSLMSLFKRPLSWEERTALTVVLVVFLTLVPFLVWIVGSIITHEEVPFEVSFPKGSPLLASNLTISNITYKNSIIFSPEYNKLTFLSSRSDPSDVRMEVLTPGWCVDIWKWMGIRKRWVLSEKCVRKFKLSYYSFSHRFVKDAGVFSWNLESGYIIVFHKENGNVTDYEEVRFKAEYRGHSDEGYFLVSLRKR